MYSVIIFVIVMSLVGAAPQLRRSDQVIFPGDGNSFTILPSRPPLERQDAVIAESQEKYPPLEDFWTKDFDPKDLRGTTTDVPWGKRKWTKSEITFGFALVMAYNQYWQVHDTTALHATNPEWGLTESQTAVVQSKAAITSAFWTAGTALAVSKCWLLPHPILSFSCSYFVGQKGLEVTSDVTDKVACDAYKKASGKKNCPFKWSLNHSERAALALKIAEMKIEEQSAKIAALEEMLAIQK